MGIDEVAINQEISLEAQHDAQLQSEYFSGWVIILMLSAIGTVLIIQAIREVKLRWKR